MNSRVPIVRPISWLAIIPSLVTLVLFMIVGYGIMRSSLGASFGALAFVIYSSCTRRILTSAHRRGMRLSKSERFEEAIPEHQASYDFFTRHAWIDRYRALTMMSCSGLCYREMALLNIAFAHGQIGNGEHAKAYYQRTLEEFPGCGMAESALRMIESIERSKDVARR